MKVYLGDTGLDQSFQDPFPEYVSCCKCGGEARPMFVASEAGGGIEKGGYVCNLQPHAEEEKRLWFHDACAVAVYACGNCLEVTAIANQA